ncbi:MAG: DUF222 domain-containing protein [Acidimicrobiia bacterium]|nr:DUF222 domain-containing protein [Acidimicrobiia bacterium]
MIQVEMAVLEERVARIEGEIAEVMGVVNAAHGRLVGLLGEALDDDLWQGWAIHSPAHWLSWQAGMSASRAQGIVKIAERRAEVPSAVAALVAGELSVDAAVAVARRAPASHEASITEFAKIATISQLQRCLRDYAYDDDADDGNSKPDEDTRSVSMGTDAQGWWLKGRLPVDQGAVVEQAIKAARDDLYRQERAALVEGERPPLVTWADGLVAAAEAALTVGEARFPGSDRYLVHLHLDASPTPDDPTGVLSLHLGPPLPAALRGLLLCDTQLRPVFEAHGTPVSIGRQSRTISRRLRRLIERRDGGCAVPGCARTTNLDIHHITHWEHGGGTDTHNLCALCRRHHRLHHLGLLGIHGNADVDGRDGLRFTDRWNRTLEPAGHPTAPDPTQTPGQAASNLDLSPGHYAHPLGERLDPWSVSFAPNPPGERGASRGAAASRPAEDPDDGHHPGDVAARDPAASPGPPGVLDRPEPPNARGTPGHHHRRGPPEVSA